MTPLVWTSLDTWIVVVGALAAMSCGLLGTYLVLRRMSMMGDAISHAVLPGLVVAFLFAGSRGGPVMLLGALVVGVLTALLTQVLHRAGKVDEGASMGVVFTTLFALGIILMVRNADAIDLDADCVLYGALEQTPLDVVSVWGAFVPRAAISLGVFLFIDIAFVLLFYRPLKIASFDPALATTMGINANLVHYLLMTLIAANVVVAFEAVGSILVVAMLIVPGAAATLLANRLRSVLLIAVGLGAFSAALGHLAAITVPRLFGYEDTRTTGSIVVAAGLLFGLVAVFAPRLGLLGRALHRLRLTLRIIAEDALGLLYRLEEDGDPVTTTTTDVVTRLRDTLGLGPVTPRLALASLVRRGLVERRADAVRMTDAGRQAAVNLVRSHRLWESYLVQRLGLAPDHVHGTAMRLEHITGPDLQQALARTAGAPAEDPHGQRIPPSVDAGDAILENPDQSTPGDSPS